MSEILFKCLSGAERSSPEQPIVLTIVVHSACLAGERMTKRTRFCLFFFFGGVLSSAQHSCSQNVGSLAAAGE